MPGGSAESAARGPTAGAVTAWSSLEPPGRVIIDMGSTAMISPASSCPTMPVTSMASPGSSRAIASVAVDPPTRTCPVPSSTVACSPFESATRPETVTRSPMWPANAAMSMRGAAGVDEAEPDRAADGEPSEAALRADSASGAGPTRTSSGERGSSWKADESEVERRTTPVTTAMRPAVMPLAAIPAAGSPRTTTRRPSTSNSTRQREPARVSRSMRPHTRTRRHSRSGPSEPAITRGSVARSSSRSTIFVATTVGPPSQRPTRPTTWIRDPTRGPATPDGRMTATAAVPSSIVIVGPPMSNRPAGAVTVASTSTSVPRTPMPDARSCLTAGPEGAGD